MAHRKGEVNTSPDTSKQMTNAHQMVNVNKPQTAMKSPSGLKKSDKPMHQQDRDFDTP